MNLEPTGTFVAIVDDPLNLGIIVNLLFTFDFLMTQSSGTVEELFKPGQQESVVFPGSRPPRHSLIQPQPQDPQVQQSYDNFPPVYVNYHDQMIRMNNLAQKDQDEQLERKRQRYTFNNSTPDQYSAYRYTSHVEDQQLQMQTRLNILAQQEQRQKAYQLHQQRQMHTGQPVSDMYARTNEALHQQSMLLSKLERQCEQQQTRIVFLGEQHLQQNFQITLQQVILCEKYDFGFFCLIYLYVNRTSRSL